MNEERKNPIGFGPLQEMSLKEEPEEEKSRKRLCPICGCGQWRSSPNDVFIQYVDRDAKKEARDSDGDRVVTYCHIFACKKCGFVGLFLRDE